MAEICADVTAPKASRECISKRRGSLAPRNVEDVANEDGKL